MGLIFLPLAGRLSRGANVSLPQPCDGKPARLTKVVLWRDMGSKILVQELVRRERDVNYPQDFRNTESPISASWDIYGTAEQLQCIRPTPELLKELPPTSKKVKSTWKADSAATAALSLAANFNVEGL